MTTSLHKDLTGADLHEPKGVASATSGQVYQADGASSGTWSTIAVPTGEWTISYSAFTASGTWTKPSNLIGVKVIVIGGGGKGSTTSAGGTTSFGAHCSATGGNTSGSTAGTGSSGNINLTGSTGQAANSGAAALRISTFGNGERADDTASAGAGGGASIKYVVEASLGATETVTISANGMANGYCLVEQYIKVV